MVLPCFTMFYHVLPRSTPNSVPTFTMFFGGYLEGLYVFFPKAMKLLWPPYVLKNGKSCGKPNDNPLVMSK